MDLLTINMSKQFKRDLKKIKKQNKDIELLRKVIDILANNCELDITYNNHKLSGDYCGYFELHLKPDWLLIYQIINKSELYLVRTGRHSELF